MITDHNQTCDGRAKDDVGEARMDIENSEMAYLGYYNGESYGLTWKARSEIFGVERRSVATFVALLLWTHDTVVGSTAYVWLRSRAFYGNSLLRGFIVIRTKHGV